MSFLLYKYFLTSTQQKCQAGDVWQEKHLPRIGVVTGTLVAAGQTTLAQAAGTCLVQLTGYTTALGHWLRGVKL